MKKRQWWQETYFNIEKQHNQLYFLIDYLIKVELEIKASGYVKEFYLYLYWLFWSE